MALLDLVENLHPEVLLDRFERGLKELGRCYTLRDQGKEHGINLGEKEAEVSELEKLIRGRMGLK